MWQRGLFAAPFGFLPNYTGGIRLKAPMPVVLAKASLGLTAPGGRLVSGSISFKQALYLYMEITTVF